jgi:hypothetical protein
MRGCRLPFSQLKFHAGSIIVSDKLKQPHELLMALTIDRYQPTTGDTYDHGTRRRLQQIRLKVSLKFALGRSLIPFGCKNVAVRVSSGIILFSHEFEEIICYPLNRIVPKLSEGYPKEPQRLPRRDRATWWNPDTERRMDLRVSLCFALLC